MITEITMYEAQCDKCGEVFFHDPYDDSASMYPTREILENSLRSHKWKNINGKWYCKECAVEVEKKILVRGIFTIAYSREEANEIAHFIMGKGYEGIQNDSYRYCREAIDWCFKLNNDHHIDHIYVGVRGCQMIVARTKRWLIKNGLRYIEKKRVFYNLLKQYE